MAKKQYFLILDTETTIEDHVYDFGAILVDRKGSIIKECSVIVRDFSDETLFYDKNAADVWGLAGLKRRTENYAKMLETGSRMLASVNAVNRWLEKINVEYVPELTAYNLAFDAAKCANSGIDINIFEKRFCLWHMACGHFANSKAYKRFIVENHLFNAPTALGNMSFKTNAEVMASFLNGSMLPPEPHTAIEDAKFYELPILQKIVNRKNWRETLKPYNWKDYQVREHFTVK